jgi:hypothetical protein
MSPKLCWSAFGACTLSCWRRPQLALARGGGTWRTPGPEGDDGVASTRRERCKRLKGAAFPRFMAQPPARRRGSSVVRQARIGWMVNAWVAFRLRYDQKGFEPREPPRPRREVVDGGPRTPRHRLAQHAGRSRRASGLAGIDEIEPQAALDADRRVQEMRQQAGTKPHARHLGASRHRAPAARPNHCR